MPKIEFKRITNFTDALNKLFEEHFPELADAPMDLASLDGDETVTIFFSASNDTCAACMLDRIVQSGAIKHTRMSKDEIPAQTSRMKH